MSVAALSVAFPTAVLIAVPVAVAVAVPFPFPAPVSVALLFPFPPAPTFCCPPTSCFRIPSRDASPWRSWVSVWPRSAGAVPFAGAVVAAPGAADVVAVPLALAVLWAAPLLVVRVVSAASVLVADIASEVEGAWGRGVARTVTAEERRRAMVVNCMAVWYSKLEDKNSIGPLGSRESSGDQYRH